MPTERFYRLPIEKQGAIRDAAVKEFARVPIDKVSINKIIQEADISRGSFYTYFEDKWDILGYIFEEGRKRMRRFCKKALEEHDGDVWLMLEDFLSATLEFCGEDDNFSFLKSVMEHSSSEQMFSGFASHLKNCRNPDEEIGRWCYEKAKKDDFRDPGFDAFHRLMTLAMPAMAVSVKSFYMGVPKETVREEFSGKLKLLRYGMCYSGGNGQSGDSADPGIEGIRQGCRENIGLG